MTLAESIITEARARNILLYVKDGQLAFVAEEGTFPEELKSRIKRCKSEIMDALLQVRAASQARSLTAFSMLTQAEQTRLDTNCEDAYPLSALQAGMVFHTELAQFTGLYHILIAHQVRCPWSRSCFEQALTACIEEHPALRTTYDFSGARPVQRVLRQIELPLGIQDLRALAGPQQTQEVLRWAETRKRHVFDWERGPLFHVEIFLRAADGFEFLLSFHHSVMDGWSRATLTTSLYQRYRQLLSGRPLAPVHSNRTYREFVAQEQLVLGSRQAAQYFRDQLLRAPEQLLPRRQAPQRGHCLGVRRVEAFQTLSAQLLTLARTLGVPVQAVLLAGHFKVIETISGHSLVTTCVTHNGRPASPAAEQAVGMFLNAMPTCMQVDTQTWRELVIEVARGLAEGFAFRTYPLARILDDLGRSLSEVLFNYTHFHVFAGLSAAGQEPLRIVEDYVFEQTNFELLVEVTRAVDLEQMHLTLAYNTCSLDESLIERLALYYPRAFRAMLEGLDDSHQVRSLLSDCEHRCLDQWSGTRPGQGTQPRIHDLIAAHARCNGSQTALISRGQHLSYRDLHERAQRLARCLRRQGVGPESRVGVCLLRSPEMIIGVLGILYAGAAYVPLDPSLPAKRLLYIASDASIECVLIHAATRDALPGNASISMDGAASEHSWLVEFAAAEDLHVGSHPNHLMYILYTSGSTGEPKGVMVEHHSVSHYVDHAVRFYLSDVDGAVLSSPLCFDATVTALWSPLVAGKPLLLLSEEDPQELSSWLFGSTRGWLFRITPAHLEALFPFDRASAPSAAPHCLVLGGERLPAGTLSRWRALLPEAKFVNEYGPTETVVGSTAYEIGAHREYWPEQGADTVSIGQPIASTRVYVLNAHRQRVPPGVSGELHIGGVGVSRGYLHGPKLTAEKFVPDPFGATAGARLYRTGDLCRWRSDGSLEFLGRNDRQVKIRGYRIEPGEIETALTSLATVRSAVVVAQEQASGEKQLVAYVVLRASSGNHSGEPPPAGELQQSLREQLPHYMVPVSFVILDEMPLTAHGKIDRRRLPPAPDPVDSQAEIVPPGNPLEAALLRLWQRVLAVERVSTTTDFLALGGHSIQALRLVTLIRAATQVHVSLQEFMRLATVREVAAHIEKQRAMQPG